MQRGSPGAALARLSRPGGWPRVCVGLFVVRLRHASAAAEVGNTPAQAWVWGEPPAYTKEGSRRAAPWRVGVQPRRRGTQTEIGRGTWRTLRRHKNVDGSACICQIHEQPSTHVAIITITVVVDPHCMSKHKHASNYMIQRRPSVAQPNGSTHLGHP